MKEIFLKVKNQNWGMIGPNDWEQTEWVIYNDLSVELKETYNSSAQDQKYKLFSCSISQENYEDIIVCLKMVKENDIKSDACDGDAWEFIQYSNGLEIWNRNLDYIYGNEQLEQITKILLGLIK